MNDTTRFPGKGVHLDPKAATLPPAPNPTGSIMRDPVDGKVKMWDGTAWVTIPFQSAGSGNVLLSFGGGTQVYVNATPAVIAYPVVTDPTNSWDVALNEWTCPETGIYEIEGVVSWYDTPGAGTVGSTRNANIQRDTGAGFLNSRDFDAVFSAVMPAGPAAPNPMHLKWRGTLTLGDKIRIRTRMDGEVAAREIGDFAVLGSTTWLSIVRDYRFAS